MVSKSSRLEELRDEVLARRWGDSASRPARFDEGVQRYEVRVQKKAARRVQQAKQRKDEQQAAGKDRSRPDAVANGQLKKPVSLREFRRCGETGAVLVKDIMRGMSLLAGLLPAESADRMQRGHVRGRHPASKRERAREAKLGREKQQAGERPTTPTAQRERDHAPRPAPPTKIPDPPAADAVATAEPIERRIRRRPGGNPVAPVGDADRPCTPVAVDVSPPSKSSKDAASPEQRLYQFLTSRGFEFVDSRPMRGKLWIIGGKELEPTIGEARALGYPFKWSDTGATQTRGRAGWWCNHMRA
jgi:hypothetical protein